jgi:hypothetical protein
MGIQKVMKLEIGQRYCAAPENGDLAFKSGGLIYKLSLVSPARIPRDKKSAGLLGIPSMWCRIGETGIAEVFPAADEPITIFELQPR